MKNEFRNFQSFEKCMKGKNVILKFSFKFLYLIQKGRINEKKKKMRILSQLSFTKLG